MITISSSHQNNNNFTPVIGILCMDIAADLRKSFGNDYYSYIAANYVKYLESAGGRVIPIWIKRPRSYYEDIMSKINGILLPGGAVYFDTTKCTEDLRSDCVQSSKYIFEIAKDLCEKGKSFPLWGTCLGFQLMLTHSANLVDIRQHCLLKQCSLPVNFESDEILASSKLFANIDKELKSRMASLSFGVHNHRCCITKKDLCINEIDKQWKVLACNKDDNGLEFITIVEHNSLPFYGFQIHPERLIFDNYVTNNKSHHCLECFELAQYFSKFFVHQCNLNGNRFNSKEEESRHSIYHFPIVLSDTADKKKFQQHYLFQDDVDYPKDEN
ncbi:gamma-glutamyl hydrolase-like [Calliphora vicina]|uniref:gamma-glutamyl hydrolase-like n=1 Tax=Calliphora vicina TaxID=7373 RepID=UPI00325BBE65